jgi:hypothetical protein
VKLAWTQVVPAWTKVQLVALRPRVSVAADDAGEDHIMSDWVVIATTVIIGFLIRMFLF